MQKSDTKHQYELERKPAAVARYDCFQYGKGGPCSAPRKIIGSIIVPLVSYEGQTVQIRYVVVKGSSQWVIGPSITRICDIIHSSGNKLVLPSSTEMEPDFLPLVEYERHTYLPLSALPSLPDLYECFSSLSATVGIQDISTSCEDTVNIGKKVHEHTCGHHSYGDIETLLERNNIWSIKVGKYSSQIIERCPHC